MDARLIALDRFAHRRFLATVARDHRPLDAGGSVIDSLVEQLRERWSALLGVAAEDLVVCASASDALGLMARCLLAPADVAVLAQPCDVVIPAGVVSAGAVYVDVGRLMDGRLDAPAANAALLGNPQAVLFAASPSLGGADDLAQVAEDNWRAVVADARYARSLAGDVSAINAGADAVVVVLRDPAEPTAPLLYGVVCAPGCGVAVAAVLGPAPLPALLLRAAICAVDWLQGRGREDTANWAAEIAENALKLEFLLADRAGISVQIGGTTALVWCLDGVVESIAQTVRSAGFSASGFGPHPMRSVVVVDLTSPTAK